MKNIILCLSVNLLCLAGGPAQVYAGPGFPQNFKTKLTKALKDMLPKTTQKKNVVKAASQLNAAAQRVQSAVENKVLRIPQPWQYSVFQLVPADKILTNASGFVVETVYQGKKEIFGFISSHITRADLRPGDKFEVIFHIGLKSFSVPAEVLLRGNHFRLDATLVRLKPTEEFLKYVKPLKLNETGVAAYESLFSAGYAHSGQSVSPNRIVKAVTPTMITTSYTLQRHKRAGFCGSPLLNAQNEVVGIHCGSLTEENATMFSPNILPKNQRIWPIKTYEQRVSLAVPSLLLGDLIRAYHQGGSFKRPVLWNGKTVAQLDIDESIEEIQLAYYVDGGHIKLEKIWTAAKEPFLNEQNLAGSFTGKPIDGIIIKVRSTSKKDNTILKTIYTTDFTLNKTKVTQTVVHK